jgi:hypothetical protein
VGGWGAVEEPWGCTQPATNQPSQVRNQCGGRRGGTMGKKGLGRNHRVLIPASAASACLLM